MGKYQCIICKYKFRSTKEPKKCPYCGKEASVISEETAEDMLKEADKIGE